MESMIV